MNLFEDAWNAPIQPLSSRNAPPGTSEVAAACVAKYARGARGRILAAIRERGPFGLTDDEGEALLGIKCQTYTPRRGELVALGFVVDSGRRRNTASGCPAAVWIAAEHAGANAEAREGIGGRHAA